MNTRHDVVGLGNAIVDVIAKTDDAFLQHATRQLYDRFEIEHVTIQVVRVPFTPPCTPLDPPVGAALPAFAAYLAEQPSTRQGTYTFTVERGFDATRKSLLHAEMDKKPGKGLKLRVGGSVVSVTSGTLHLPG